MIHYSMNVNTLEMLKYSVSLSSKGYVVVDLDSGTTKLPNRTSLHGHVESTSSWQDIVKHLLQEILGY